MIKIEWFDVIWSILYDLIKKLFGKKKEIPENIKNDFKDIYGDVIPIYKPENVIIFKPVIQNNFLTKTRKDYTTKSKKLKIRYSQENYNNYTFIYSHRFIYPHLRKLLTSDANVGLDIYLSHFSAFLKDKKRLNYILEGINQLDKLSPLIYEWFKIFEDLQLNGSLEGIILPLTQYLKNEPLNRKIKEQFTTFIKNLNISGVIQPIQIGNKKISIVRVGEKNLRNYLGTISSFQKRGSDIIIICGRGKYISRVVDITDIFKRLYKHVKFKQEIIPTTAYENKEHLLNKSKGFSCLYIHLFKLP